MTTKSKSHHFSASSQDHNRLLASSATTTTTKRTTNLSPPSVEGTIDFTYPNALVADPSAKCIPDSGYWHVDMYYCASIMESVAANLCSWPSAGSANRTPQATPVPSGNAIPVSVCVSALRPPMRTLRLRDRALRPCCAWLLCDGGPVRGTQWPCAADKNAGESTSDDRRSPACLVTPGYRPQRNIRPAALGRSPGVSGETAPLGPARRE